MTISKLEMHHIESLPIREQPVASYISCCQYHFEKSSYCYSSFI